MGDAHEAALWFNADKPTEYSDAKKGIEIAFVDTALALGVMFGPISFEIVDPLSPRVPPPPANFRGAIRCLIGTATVVSLWTPRESRFTDDLKPSDLADLRRATRQAFMQAGGFTMTDEECDDWINEVGPDAAVDTFH